MLNISRDSEVNIINTLIDHDVISGADLIKIKKKAIHLSVASYQRKFLFYFLWVHIEWHHRIELKP